MITTHNLDRAQYTRSNPLHDNYRVEYIMQTITVNLNALAVAQGFRLLTDSERVDFLDALMCEYSGNNVQMFRDLRVMAEGAHNYSDDAGMAVEVFGEAFTDV